jgi:hypothetical protein
VNGGSVNRGSVAAVKPQNDAESSEKIYYIVLLVKGFPYPSVAFALTESPRRYSQSNNSLLLC